MRKATWVPDRGEMIWINFNPQAGREMRDKHPMLILSPKKFNQHTRIVIGLPMTTSEYNATNPFAVKFTGLNGVASYILAHQPKSFDWHERDAKPHPWKRVPAVILKEACEILNQIL